MTFTMGNYLNLNWNLFQKVFNLAIAIQQQNPQTLQIAT